MSAALQTIVRVAPMPPTVWHIAVAALIGNAYGPQWETEDITERTSRVDQRESGTTVTISDEVVTIPKRGGLVVPSGRWSGPMGRPPKMRP